MLGEIISSAASLFGQNKANKENKKLAREEMAFQERMSNTQHQRGVADLRAAGLNPRLSALASMSASSPSGASATMQDALTPAVNSALSSRMNNAQVENLKVTNDQIKSATRLNDAQSASVGTNTALAATKLPANEMKAKVFQSINDRLSSAAQSYRSNGSLWDNLKKSSNLFTPLKGALANRLGF